MSRIALNGNASGTGTVTIASPNTNSDQTLTLPDATGTAVIQDASNNLLMNSGYGSDAVAYGCRAWVNFNGTGTVAIRASGNVSSITDNNVGDYTVNFTTAMPDANYSCVGGARDLAAMWFFGAPLTSAPTTSAIRCRVLNSAGTNGDAVYVFVAIHR